MIPLDAFIPGLGSGDGSGWSDRSLAWRNGGARLTSAIAPFASRHPASIAVDPARGRVLTLLHEPRHAIVATIAPQAAPTSKDTAWLDELRRYTGKATSLSKARTIAGQPAQGWLLDLGGSAVELWAGSDGLSLEMRMGDGGLQIDYRFAFDLEFARELLDSGVPAGYTQVEEDKE